MIPLDGRRLVDLVAAALLNCDAFDQGRFAAWLSHQPADIQRAAARCPPDRIYRIRHNGRADPPLLGVVMGYRGSRKGEPGVCAVLVLGVREGIGSADSPLFVPTSGLEDVTAAARAGKLRLDGSSSP